MAEIYVSTIKPHTAKKVDPKVITLLRLIEKDAFFQQRVEKIRKKYNIPQGGFQLKDLYSAIENKYSFVLGQDNEKNDELFEILDLMNEASVKKSLEPMVMERFFKFLSQLSNQELEDMGKYMEEAKTKVDYLYSDKVIKLIDSKRYMVDGEISLIALSCILHKEVKKIADHFGFKSLASSISSYIAFGIFTTFRTKPDFVYLESKESILAEINNHDGPVGALIFYEDTSKQQLIKWIEDYWEGISDHIKKLPKLPTEYSRNTLIGERIYELHKSGKTFPEISTLLFDEFPDDERVADTGWIKTTFRRYEIRLNKLKRNNFS